MRLKPIQFNTAQDVSNFINYLVKSKAITLNGNGTPQIIFNTNHALLKANDGNLYLSKSVEDYLNQHSDEEIQASQITFTNKEGIKISLLEIKQDLNLINSLATPEENQYIKSWNLNWYSDLQVPSLKSGEQIDKARTIYNNSQVHSSIRLTNSILSLSNSSISLAESLLGHLGTIFALNPARLINRLQQDFLRVTLQQEKKMKLHLLKEKRYLSNEKDIQKIDKWIEELDKNNVQSKELLESVIDILKANRYKIQKAQHKLALRNEANITIEDRKKELDELDKKHTELLASISNSGKFLDFLTSTLIWGAVTLSIAIPIAAIILTLLFAAPVVGIIVSSITIAAGFSLMFFSEEIGNTITSMHEALDAKIDSLLDNKRSELQDIEKQCSSLREECFLYECNKSPIEERILSDYDALIASLESDLAAISEPPPAAKTVFQKKNATTPGAASLISMFRLSNTPNNDGANTLQEEAKYSMKL